MAHENATLRPWGLEVTGTKIWLGPLRPDGIKVDDIVTCFDTGPSFTGRFNVSQADNAALIVEAVNAYDTLKAEKAELLAALKEASASIAAIDETSVPLISVSIEAWARVVAAQAKCMRAIAKAEARP